MTMSSFPRPFRFRLNCIDHYQAAPTSLDPQLPRTKDLKHSKAPTIPIIRIFGATETGQKVCAHVRGAYPYVYIPYEGGTGEDEVREYMDMLTLSINHALSLSYRRNPYDQASGTFVAHISLVKGVPFFGYHVGYKTFLKIYLLNPLNMNRLADLLTQGAILARVFQPHESHMQYLAQWMCDYNLFGCSFIDCAEARFRGTIPEHATLSNPNHYWSDATINAEWLSDEGEFLKQSHCTLEVDICVQHILNRKEIQPRNIHHDFLERFQDLRPDEKFVHSMAGLWRDETVRRKKKMGLKDPDSSPFPAEVMISMSAEPRAGKSDWIHEQEYRDLVDGLIEQERRIGPQVSPEFESFIQGRSAGTQIRTAFESVEDLYPANLEHTNGNRGQPGRSKPPPSVLVNETSISQIGEVEDDGYHSDEEVAKQQYLSQRERLGRDSDPHERSVDTGTNQPDQTTHTIDNAIVDAIDANQVSNEQSVLRKSEATTSSLKRRASGSDSPGRSMSKRKRSASLEDHELSLLHSGDQDRNLTLRRVTFQVDSNKTQGPPTSSQLSQSSIKAQAAAPQNSFGFTVTKSPYSSQNETRLPKKTLQAEAEPPKKRDVQPGISSASPTDVTPKSATRSASSENSPGIMRIPPILIMVSAQLPTYFAFGRQEKPFCYSKLPPTSEEVVSSMLDYDILPVLYQDAFYSKENDVPDRPREYAGREFRLESVTLPYLPPFDKLGNSAAARGEKSAVVRDLRGEEHTHARRRQECSLRNWEIATRPPSFDAVERWMQQQTKMPSLPPHDSSNIDDQISRGSIKHKLQPQLSQIDGPTQRNKHGFEFSQKIKGTSVEHETQYMTLMSLEVHVNTRANFAPDPAQDEIACIFWSCQADVKTSTSRYESGVLALSQEDGVAQEIAQSLHVEVQYEEDELDLLNKIVDVVRDLDPDILTGYEVHNGSWGYLIERARMKYEFDLCEEFSRMKSQSHGRFGKDSDRWGFQTTSTIRVTGRHMINIWRAMRGELNLLQYTMENVVFHLLHKRIPHYSFADLTRWYRSGKSRNIAKTANYFVSRAQINLQILEANELIPRTSEQARLLGVDFFSVFSRGSQFKVESIMFRIAKPESYILVSPTRKQVGGQNALECLPLVMEPQSAFYSSPLLVLDFQSLYPSVMIAYNYCYSTFLGRVVNWRGTNKMGFTDFKREPRILELVKDHLNIAPNGIMYCKPEMRKSLLAKMLGEILETRVMVKSGMKEDKGDKTLQQLLNNRQLALKLLANVTYGYTSASFSGRMPCSEIADSIVQTGRETLEKAIALIHSIERWGAEVVYGDTDSLFVYLKGRTRDQAFDIGQEIADAVTNANPRPIKLKFEKVYHPCVLLAKKRYVGFKYEHRSQKEPDFDAKGIETVRRDGTPAEQKIEEKALKMLFRTQDLSKIKTYFQAQCTKIMTGKVSIQDFLFAKEVKLGTYADKGPPPPGALIATKRMLQDPRQEPQYGERVPYVVITGAPGARLIDRCVDPERLLNDDHLELDADYYIGKNLIPPLERIFNLVGANVKAWFDEMPKVQRVRSIRAPAQLAKVTSNAVKKTLESYLHSTTCLVCRSKLPPPPPVQALSIDQPSPLPICEVCAQQPSTALFALKSRRSMAEKRVRHVKSVCKSCSGLDFGDEIRCDSRDCPVFYTRTKEESTFEGLKQRVDGVIEILEEQDIEKELDW